MSSATGKKARIQAGNVSRESVGKMARRKKNAYKFKKGGTGGK